MAIKQRIIIRAKRGWEEFYNSIYFPPAVIFAAILIATLISWQGTKGSVHSGLNLDRAGAVLVFGIFFAILASALVLLVMQAKSRDLTTQRERAVALAKDELLSLASHQMRTPATGVKQYIGMVLQGFAGKITVSQKKLLQKAYASNDRQLRIINEILHLAKIDSGRIVLAKQPTELGGMIKDIVNEQKPDIESARHKVTTKLPKHPLIVYADTHMLRMAIENLLSNAIKYTERGGNIKIELYQKQRLAFVKVSDTGIGIEPDDIGRVFDQFARLQNEMSQRVGGTGIGLYLTKHLIEAHDGTVNVESQPGKGSVFTVTLPAAAQNTISAI